MRKMDWGSTCFFLFCAVVVLCAVVFDYQKNKLIHPIHLERMSAIEEGIPPTVLNERPIQVYFLRGLLWLIPGLGLAAFLWLVSEDFSTAWGGAGVLMTCIGLAYLLSYFHRTAWSELFVELG
jgi:hypothetical protein